MMFHLYANILVEYEILAFQSGNTWAIKGFFLGGCLSPVSSKDPGKWPSRVNENGKAY